MIKRPYQCGVDVYELASCECVYDCFDKYFSIQDFELCYMDINSFYLAMSGNSLDEFVKPEMRHTYEAEKKIWLAAYKFSERKKNLKVQEACGLLQSATLFKARPEKINMAVKLLQRRIMICTFSAIKMS